MLALTSTTYLLPSLLGFWTNHTAYSIACLNLYLSSQAYHRTHHRFAYVWDQVAIQIVWWMGAYYNTQIDILYSSHYWLITLYLWYVYFYGYLKKMYCFGPNGDTWHATIHFSSVAGILYTQYITKDRV